MNSELEIKQEAMPSTPQAGPDETSNSVSSIPNLLHDGDEHAAAFHSSRELVEDHSGPQQQQQQHEPLPTAEDAANAADNNGGSTMYKYRDFGHVEDDGEDAGSEDIPLPTASSNRNSSESSIRVQKFPVKLYAILAQKEFQDIICWMPHGRSWKVLKPSMFESLVMPLFFEYSNYHSFNRLVNAWSFRRISTGPDRGSYYHELFLRGKPHLQKYMRRLPKTHKKLPMQKKDEPDFYKLDQTNPLPEVHEAPVPGAAATVQAMRNGPVTTTNPNMSPLSHNQSGSAMGSSSSCLVTPNISPYHSQNIIGGPQHASMINGSPSGGSMNGMNSMGNMSSGYMRSNNMNSMGFMSSGGSLINGSMMSINDGAGGFNQGSLGMMGGGHSGNMGCSMMMGTGGPMSNSGGNPNGMSSMGGSGSMSPVGRGNSSMSNNARYSSYNDMGSQDEYDIPLMGAGSPQMSFSSMGHNMNTSIGHGNHGYGSSNAGYMGGGSQSYSSVPPSPAPNSMRRTMPMRQTGMDSPSIMGNDQQHMTPQHQQQYMSDMYVPQGQSQMSPPMHMQDMMQQQPLHSQQNMYNGGGGSSSGAASSGSPSASQQQRLQQQHQQDQQEDYHGSGSPNVSQQQQRASPPRTTA